MTFYLRSIVDAVYMYMAVASGYSSVWAPIRKNTESPNDINFTVRRQQHINIFKMLLSVRKSQQPQAHVCKHHLKKKNTFRNIPRHQPTLPSEFMNKTKHASSSSVSFFELEILNSLEFRGCWILSDTLNRQRFTIYGITDNVTGCKF